MNGFVIIHEHVEQRIQDDLDALRDSLPVDERVSFEMERNLHRQEIINHIGEYGTYPQINGLEKVA